MGWYKIMVLVLGLCIELPAFCQNQNDSLLDDCLREIKGEKFDSLGTVGEVPSFIKKYLTVRCGKFFKILSPEKFIRRYNRIGIGAVSNRFEFSLRSSQYYLICYTKFQEPYQEGYLMVIKFNEKTVVVAYKLTRIDSQSASGLLNRLSKKTFEVRPICE